MDAEFGWLLLVVGLVSAGIGLLGWVGWTRRSGLLLYGIFGAGLFVTGVSFLLNYGLALGMAGRNRSIDLGMIGGSIVAGAGLMLRAVMVRRVALVLAGGIVGAVGGWLLGSFLVNGANWTLERLLERVLRPTGPADYWYAEWPMALCLTPYGMWLGLLAGGRQARPSPS